MAVLEQLRVLLNLDAGQYKREAKEASTATGQIATAAKTTGTATGRMKEDIGRAGAGIKLALVGVALAAVTSFVKGAKDAYNDLNESLNAVTVSYGKSAAGILQLGKQSATSLGLSNAEFNTFAVQFSAFAQQIAGDGGDVVGVVEVLSTRVSDFASVMNLEVAEAATLFQSGLAGETEPLRKYGIDLSAAAVEAHALAVGIASGTGPLTEQEKVLARHSLLMQQTEKVAGDFANTSGELANQERILNAQLENNKALVGQAISGAYKAAIPVVAGFGDVLGDMALAFMELTGAMSAADVVLRNISMGWTSATTPQEKFSALIEEQMTQIGHWTNAVFDAEGRMAAFVTEGTKGIEMLGLTTEELVAMRDHLPAISAGLDLTTESEAAFAESLNQAIIQQKQQEDQLAENELRMAAMTGATDLTAAEMAELEGETAEATSALQRFEDEVRSQTEPLFALVEATDNLAAAEAAVVAAENEFTRNSPEYDAAVLDLALAHEDLVAAQLKVAEQSGFTRADFETHLRNMGITNQQVIDDILVQFDRVNAFKFSEHTIRVNAALGGPAGARRALEDQIGFHPGVQHGGPVRPGQIYRVGEHNAPEIMLIPGDSGAVFSNSDSRRLLSALTAGGGGNGGVTVERVYAMGTPASIAKDVGDQIALQMRMYQ